MSDKIDLEDMSKLRVVLEIPGYCFSNISNYSAMSLLMMLRIGLVSQSTAPILV